jgi:MAC/Perforin domain
MDGTENNEPKQVDLPDCNHFHHSVYEVPRYFLTAREKKSNTLYIISDQENKEPLRLSPDQSQQFVFTADDLILKFNPKLRADRKPDKVEFVDESFSIEGKKDEQGKTKPLPDQFLPVPGYEVKCIRPDILHADSGLQEKFGDIFAHNLNNFEMSLLGWNEIRMKDPFDSSSTGAENRIFMLPPSDSKCYVKSRNYVVPYGWKFVPKAYSEGSMHSALVANGSDLRNSATKTQSIKASAKGGCALVSGRVSFNYNSELGHTEEKMYDKEVMHSEHTYFVSVHTLVLDKSNVRLSTEHAAGRLTGFLPDIREYDKGRKRGVEIFSRYGTHYADAICYGARGRARQTYTKETMSKLLQDCKKIGWGVEAKLSVKIQGYSGGIGGGYSKADADDDSSKISKTQNSEDSEYSCIGGSACTVSGHVEGVDQHCVPVLLDLRPITELLAPPFFDDYEMTVNARRRLEADLKNYLVGKKPKEVDVFHYLSLTFLQPEGEVHNAYNVPPGFQLGPFRSDKAAVKIGSSKSNFQLPEFTGKDGALVKQAFCYPGNKTDHQIFVEFILPAQAQPGKQKPVWWYGPDEHPLIPYQGHWPLLEMKLAFALDDKQLLSEEGVKGTFVMPSIRVCDLRHWSTVLDLTIKFPVILKCTSSEHFGH